ncbi:MAG: hypothetical protein U0M51_00220 [Eggerthellaceae bacterium]
MAQTGAGGGMAADGRCGGAARACDAGAAGACGHDAGAAGGRGRDAGAAGGRGRRSASGRGIGKSQSPAGAFVKHYVDVIMRLRDDGRIVPLSVCWDDGRTFHIDQVLDGPISNAPRSANRRTLRYTVRIGRRRTNLFLECEAGEGAPIATRTLRWYVEVPEGMPLYRYFAE